MRAIWRGLCKRCPHCGQGRLFSGWFQHVARCPACGLIYERNPGDTWAFTIIGDRIPVAILVVLVYFGLFRGHHAIGLVVFGVLGAALVLTAPNRWGVGIALHYLSRVLAGPCGSHPGAAGGTVKGLALKEPEIRPFLYK